MSVKRTTIAMFVVSLTGIHAANSQAVPSTPDTSLVGLWGADVDLRPRVHGPIVIDGTGTTSWMAHIDSHDVASTWIGHGWRFTLPDTLGQLDISLPESGTPLHGFWFQPPGLLGWFASPVPMTLVWSPGPVLHGTIAPLDQRFALYLNVQPGDSGTLRGTFRNPEAGWNGGLSTYRVARGDSTVDLSDPASGKVRFNQPFDSAKRTITMDFGTPFELVPITPAAARGYLPRNPKLPLYTYREPVEDGDGWKVATASSVGLSDSMLAELVRRIIAVDINDPLAPLIHSVLVARKGKLVLDEYFFGFSPDQPHDLRSASKTITGIMAGIAIDHGDLALDTKVYAVLDSTRVAEPDRSAMTVGNLLSHASGFACNDNDDASPGNEENFYTGKAKDDWVGYTLALPMAHPPGSTYAYCSAGINLAGAMVARRTGTSLLEYFYQRVALPMQMNSWHMNLMPNGEAYAGGGLYLRSRDFLKLGQMYLNGGTWNGVRVVSRAWVERSTTRVIDVPDEMADGYAWHLHMLTHNGRTYREYEASGNGGQLMIVLPELDLVVVFNAGNYNRYRVWRKFREELVPEYVIGAVDGRR